MPPAVLGRSEGKEKASLGGIARRNRNRPHHRLLVALRGTQAKRHGPGLVGLGDVARQQAVVAVAPALLLGPLPARPFCVRPVIGGGGRQQDNGGVDIVRAGSRGFDGQRRRQRAGPARLVATRLRSGPPSPRRACRWREEGPPRHTGTLYVMVSRTASTVTIRSAGSSAGSSAADGASTAASGSDSAGSAGLCGIWAAGRTSTGGAPRSRPAAD